MRDGKIDRGRWVIAMGRREREGEREDVVEVRSQGND